MSSPPRARSRLLQVRAPSVRTVLVPPRLASLPTEQAQLEYSSRSIVFTQDGTTMFRAWGRPDRTFVLAVSPAARRWEIRAWGCGPATARRAVRELFSLEDPVEEFYRQTRVEPILRGTEWTFRGLRPPRDANLYEALLHAVVGQQLSVAAANALKRRLIERFGGFLSVDGAEVPLLPSPAELAQAGPGGLRSVGLSRAKVTSLLGLVSWLPRAPSPAELRTRPLEEAVAELERLVGVGRWTAENALLRGAGRRDVFVAGDLGVRAALERFGALARTAPEERARAWARRHYPGWGSYATLYLWRKFVASSVGDAAG